MPIYKIIEHFSISISKVQEKNNSRTVKERDCMELKFARKIPQPKQH